MANDVTSKVILGLDPSEFRRGIQQVDSKLKETSKLFGNLGQAIGAAFSVSQIQAFAAEAIQLGSQMQTVGKGFARFGDQAQLEQLRKSTRGLVTDLDLMKATVMAGNFGIPIEQLGGLLEFAKRRAQETGQSVDYLVESIVTGIGRKSPLILDNLGISTTRLKEKFNGAALEAQSIADVAQAVGDIATEELGKMGTAVDTAADKMVRLSTTWQNFKASVGELIAPAASGFLEGLTNMLNIGETMGPALNRLGVATGTAKPSDLVKPQGKTSPIAQQAVEVQKVVVSLESMRQAIKDLEAEYNTTQVGTARFYELRNAIEEANYQLGRASGEIYPGTTDKLIELQTKGLKPVTNELTSQNMVLRSSVIPAYDEMGKMVQGARTQMENMALQLQAAATFGAEFGNVLNGAFTAAMNNGTTFFEEIGNSIRNYVQQLATALATTAALSVLFSAITGTPINVAFAGIAQGTGLGGLFGEGGILNMNARVSGSDLLLGTQRSGNNFTRSGGG
jgi:hypothetical protein